MVRASGSYPEGHRFESHHRYQNQKLWHEEKYPRGRRGSPAKGVVRETVARVRLPLSPPSIRQPDKGCLFLYFGTYVWQRKRACPSLMPLCGIRSLHAIGRTSFRKRRLISPTIAERQIPLSPPHHRTVKAVLFCWRERRKEPSLMPPCGIRSLHAIGRTSSRRKASLSRQRSPKSDSLSPPNVSRSVSDCQYALRQYAKYF